MSLCIQVRTYRNWKTHEVDFDLRYCIYIVLFCVRDKNAHITFVFKTLMIYDFFKAMKTPSILINKIHRLLFVSL